MPLLHDLSIHPSDRKFAILLPLVPGHTTSPVVSLNSMHAAVNDSFIKCTQGIWNTGKTMARCGITLKQIMVLWARDGMQGGEKTWNIAGLLW